MHHQSRLPTPSVARPRRTLSRELVLLAGTMLFTACGSTTGDPAAETVPEDRFVDAMAHAVCDDIAECC
jgi:hypothetical protein